MLFENLSTNLLSWLMTGEKRREKSSAEGGSLLIEADKGGSAVPVAGAALRPEVLPGGMFSDVETAAPSRPLICRHRELNGLLEGYGTSRGAHE